MKKITLGITFLLISILTTAQIINIPDDYPTIQQGIDAASDGDTVLVQPATYQENIDFLGKDITVGSLYLTTGDTSYIMQTVIDGNQNGTVVIFENEESPDAVLTGFVITNGNSETSGGGISCIYSSPHLDHLIIVENYALYNGGGIICGAMASPTLVEVIVTENEAGNDGGGIFCFNYCNPSLSNVMIFSNTGNHGGGMCILGNSLPILENVVINNNEANQGGGIFSGPDCNFELTGAIVEDNTATSDGGGIFMSENSPVISESMINDNYAQRGGWNLF